MGHLKGTDPRPILSSGTCLLGQILQYVHTDTDSFLITVAALKIANLKVL